MTEAGPSRHVSPGGDLPLSNLGQLELLRAMIERGLPLRTRVRGFSMTPLIRDDDVVTIVPVVGRDPRVGEVVACVLPEAEKLILHRVVAREGEGWLVRGDNCRESDGVVVGEGILGSITRVERNGRDVRFGTGFGRAGIARLSRSGSLGALGGTRRSLRRVASSTLRHAQGFTMYRAAGRRLAPRIDIGEASEVDLHAVNRLFDASEAELPPQGPASPGVINWVAKRGARVVGFVRLVDTQAPESPWMGHWLFSLTVRGRYRGLGVGEALTLRVVERARAQGAPYVLLAVFEDNENAIRLYWKLGFTPAVIDGLEPVFEAEKRLSGRRRVVMQKDLRTGAV
jgi:ribosomal protein S18 acetylase RimI-like enzyme